MSAVEMESRDQSATGGRRAGRRARKRAEHTVSAAPYVKRNIPVYELLSEESLTRIEATADRILEEVGIEFRGDPEALPLWKAAGADVQGERVRMPRGLPRKIIQDNAPRQFTWHARNPAKSVEIGGDNVVFAPAYGSPFTFDLDDGRRYATIEDFQNFVKLAYVTPHLHVSGGTICEPVDLPVNKRHLDMVYSHFRFSDKAVMGSVTAAERAEDTVSMAKIVFGEDFVDSNCVLASIINVNSPLVLDATMLDALKVYARAGQASIVTPFILGGAMGPVSAAGALAQFLAEAMAGMAYAQLIRPGAPVMMGNFLSSMSMRSGSPTFGTPEPDLALIAAGQLARRLGVPLRGGGSLTAAKLPDAQAFVEGAASMKASVLAGINYVMHCAGWQEGGLVMGYEKFIIDTDICGAMTRFLEGIDCSDDSLAMDAFREVEPGNHFLQCEHTKAHYKTAFYDAFTADNNSFEQWSDAGAKDTARRANDIWRKQLEEYQAPDLDPGIDEALQAFIRQRKDSMPDASF